MVQWLRLRASTAGSMGSILGQGTKIPQARQRGVAKKKKKTEKSNFEILVSFSYTLNNRKILRYFGSHHLHPEIYYCCPPFYLFFFNSTIEQSFYYLMQSVFGFAYMFTILIAHHCLSVCHLDIIFLLLILFFLPNGSRPIH